MNLRQIEAFKAVMEAGTVTQAAARLNVSQPAVSKLLQLLEQRSGLVLFTRDRGRLSPTPEARLLYEEVERIFQGADRVRQAAHEIRSLQRGTLAVGVMPALSVGFAQEVLARLQVKQPGVSVLLHGRETPKLVEQLVLQQIDLLYSVVQMDHPEVRVELLCKVPLVCILPPHHRLAAKREIVPKDLAGERFAAFRNDSTVRRGIDQVFEAAKVKRTIAMEAPMAPSICAFVARGLGVSIVNPLYVGAFAPALAVRAFKPRIESSIYLATRRGKRLSVVAEAFAQASREFAAQAEAANGLGSFEYG